MKSGYWVHAWMFKMVVERVWLYVQGIDPIFLFGQRAGCCNVDSLQLGLQRFAQKAKEVNATYTVCCTVQPYCQTFQNKVNNVTAFMFIVQHVLDLKGEIEVGATIFVWTIGKGSGYQIR